MGRLGFTNGALLLMLNLTVLIIVLITNHWTVKYFRLMTNNFITPAGRVGSLLPFPHPTQEMCTLLLCSGTHVHNGTVILPCNVLNGRYTMAHGSACAPYCMYTLGLFKYEIIFIWRLFSVFNARFSWTMDIPGSSLCRLHLVLESWSFQIEELLSEAREIL